MANFQDLWNYTLNGSSTPWYSLFGNTNITNPLLNITFDDVIRRIDLDPYGILQIDFNANFVSSRNVCFIFSFMGMINLQNSPALYWVSDVLTIAGAYYGDATVRTFGNLTGQTITNPSISVSVTINNTNRTMRFTAGGYDSGVVSLLPSVNTRQLVFVGNNTIGGLGDTQGIEIGTLNYNVTNISATSNIELPELVINGSISNPVSVVVPTDPQLDITETIQDWAYDISKKAKTTGEALNEDAINVSIENILSTLRGERLFAPLFGSNLTTQIFDSLNVTKAQNLLDELMFAIELWEDRVTIIKEQIEMNILTEENAFTLVLPYIINRNGLTGSFARKVIL